MYPVCRMQDQCQVKFSSAQLEGKLYAVKPVSVRAFFIIDNDLVKIRISGQDIFGLGPGQKCDVALRVCLP